MLKRTSRSLLVVALLAGLLAAGTAGQGQGAGGGPFDELGPAIAAQERHTDRLLAIQGIVGTAVGLRADGQPVVQIFTEAAGVAGLPATLDGVPVVVKVTGPFVALCHKGGKDPKGCPPPEEPPPPEPEPTDRWPRPVPIGISTGNEGECSSGTIGARVTHGGNVYALSNNHVYALENNAPKHSDILQPGRADTNCNIDSNDVIATLSDFEPIVFSTEANNTIDAAIAVSSTADLGNATPADGYGLPKTAIVSESLGQAVQKYGRTTSLTKGTITGINATVNVRYSSGTARFVDQIIIEGARGPYFKAGDSGSLLVTDPGRNPVGLLFAGNRSGKLAVANRIDLVLSAFHVTIDGE